MYVNVDNVWSNIISQLHYSASTLDYNAVPCLLQDAVKYRLSLRKLVLALGGSNFFCFSCSGFTVYEATLGNCCAKELVSCHPHRCANDHVDTMGNNELLILAAAPGSKWWGTAELTYLLLLFSHDTGLLIPVPFLVAAVEIIWSLQSLTRLPINLIHVAVMQNLGGWKLDSVNSLLPLEMKW